MNRVKRKKQIFVSYVDFWDGFKAENYGINEILSKYYDVQISDNPDYIFSSVYSKKYARYGKVRIFYSGECFCPDFNLFDYGIGFEKLDFGDRYIWYPNWLINPQYDEEVEMMAKKHKNFSPASVRDKFCSFVVSNGKADEIRTAFFHKLSEYKIVNSGGTYLNNIDEPSGIRNKLEFQQQHKFSICFENESHPGYITEKLIQGFAAGTIPIYWGAPNVTDIFNEKSMVIVKDANDFERAIEKIIMIDNDDRLYKKMLSEPALIDEDFVYKKMSDFEKFLISIIEQPIEAARRRPKGQTVKGYYQMQSEMKINNFKSSIIRLKNALKK